MECDAQGKVLWMSEQTRAALGSPENLVLTIPQWQPPGTPVSPGRGVELCYTTLWEADGRYLIGARPPDQPAAGIPGESTLFRLQTQLLHHYFRLQRAERSLSTRARRRRPPAFRAIRQVELERQRLGRELHTGIGQALSAVRLQVEVISSQLNSPTASVRQALDHIASLAADALEQVRTISKRLHPPEWQRLTLTEALRQVWELSGIPQRFNASLSMDPLPRDPVFEAKVLLYRAAQEAISNLIRHSRATRVSAALESREYGLILRFQDNGVGFDCAQLFVHPASVAAGIGLRSIREQAEALGGSFSIESGPSGTTLQVSVPWVPDRA